MTRHILAKILAAAAAVSMTAACGGGAAPATPSASTSSAATKPPAAASTVASASAKPSGADSAKPAASGSTAAKPAASGLASASPKAVSATIPAPNGNPAITPAAVQGDPQLQENAQHTGRSSYVGSRQLKLARTYQAPTPKAPVFGNQPDIQSDVAIAPDGTIYLSEIAGLLLALADSGTDTLAPKWQYEQAKASGYHATPAIASDGSVLLGISGSQNPSTVVYAFKAPASGVEPQIAWQYDMGPGRMTSSITVGSDGTAYAIGGEGNMAALGPDGKLKWTVQVGPSSHAAPALAGNGVVYLPSTDGNLYAVAQSGSGTQGGLVWKFAFGDRQGLPVSQNRPGGEGNRGSSVSPTIGPDGTIYVGANNSNFYAVRPDGTLKWKFEAEPEIAGIWSTAALSADGKTVYFGANKGGVYALNTSDGSKVWQNQLFGGSIFASPTLDKNGTLYVGTTSGHVFALQASNGEQLSVFDTAGAVWTTPAVRPDGTLVAANRNGLVTVFSS